MKVNSRAILSLALLASTTRVTAQLASVCPKTDVCFQLNIPEKTASSGSGDIFFQISAPSTYEWVALGQGKSMAGSNMFVVYTSSGGNNVTLSPRTASGYTMPNFNDDAQVTLLEGSSVSNGKMTANVKCSNCNSWSGGSMDFKASSGNWVYAYSSSNGPKNSNDKSATIRQHNQHATFSWNWASAKGGSSVNPLINVSPSGSASAGATPTNCIQRNAASASGSSTSGATSPTQSGDDSTTDNHSGYGRPTGFSFSSTWPTARPTSRPPVKRQNLPYCDEVNGGNSNSGFTPISSSSSGNRRTMLVAHGVLASLAFVILFPMGAIAIRLASFPGVVWLHAAFQIFAYVVYIAGFGLGVYLATQNNLLDRYHPIIGIVVLALIFFQPILGFLHHAGYKKHKHRTLWSYAHIWLGRIAITLGIINGGLGLKLADSFNMSSRSGMIAYGVVAGFMWLVWVAASIIGERKKSTVGAKAPPKYSESARHGSGSGSEAPAVPHPESGHYAPKNQ